MRTLILATVVLTACGIDVNRRPLGPDQFIVEAQGRDADSHADILEAAHHEAAAACKGPYQVLDSTASQQGRGTRVIGAPTLDVVLTIQCGAATGATAALSPASE